MTVMYRRIILFLAAAVFAGTAAAQQATTETTTTAAAPAPPTVVANIDSSETREQLREVLNRLPPQVGKALKLDSTLWTNQSYLANYPALAVFAASHPEVAHSPAYFLESVWIPGDPTPETASFRIWNDLLEAISIFGVIAIIAGVFTWLIKTIMDHRRWTRLSTIQADVHNKLLDRFASNEDLMAYVNTPAGRHFLESSPIPLEAGPRAVSAPIGRVLWSVQLGIVLTAAGLGMKYVSWNVGNAEVGQPMGAVGVLGIAIGIGFIIAAVASFILSRRLGLWQPPKSELEAPVTE